jgi:hypothetical protein
MTLRRFSLSCPVLLASLLIGCDSSGALGPDPLEPAIHWAPFAGSGSTVTPPSSTVGTATLPWAPPAAPLDPEVLSGGGTGGGQ